MRYVILHMFCIDDLFTPVQFQVKSNYAGSFPIDDNYFQHETNY